MDALELTSPFFSKCYTYGYEFLVGKLPNLWAVFFDLTDKDAMQGVFQSARRIYNGLNTAKLVKHIREGGYDVIVTTHFLSTEVVGNMRLKGLTSARLVTIVTDYDVHKIWLSKGVDLYLVATPYTRSRLMALGVDEKKIAVTGIPCDERFVAPRDRKEVRRRLGLHEGRFTVLLSTSSFGLGPIEELAGLLADEQMIIICGHNEGLFKRMSAHARPLHKVFRFVDNMEELMAASDCMITKPGGLSITEALANHMPLIFFSAIPGQEAGNVRVLAAHGIGLSGKPLPEIAGEIKRLSSEPGALEAAREKCGAIARPHSVRDIIEQL
jgi:processive 1,2-diacylglycerol beta-glucosyltransferase